MLDTHREVVTPEGIALHLPAAGPVPRALAWAIDFALRAGLALVAALLLGLVGKVGSGVMGVVAFVLFWFYPVLFEALWDGRTPGKRALGLRVVAGNGAPVGWLATFLRNLLRTVDMLPFGYAAGLVCCLADAHGRRLGDLVADTQVVHVAREIEAGAMPAVAALAPPVALRPHEQAAVLAFAERGVLLTPARQAELADIAAPLVHAQGTDAVLRLQGMAAWLLGRR